MAHVVALVPGFLGFNHLGDRTYFADRFLAGLRAGLEARLGNPITVFPVPTLPIGSLADRQKELVTTLEKVAVPNPIWHLVGHSTGGLDAALLCRTHALRNTEHGSDFSPVPLDVSIRSVTTIAAPHYGTCLALAPLPAMTQGHGVTLRGLADFVRLGADVTQHAAMLSRIHFLLGSLGEGNTPQFLSHLLFHDALAKDLSPAVAARLTATENRRKNAAVHSFATVAPPPVHSDHDGLYRDLWRWTQEVEAPPPPRDFIRPKSVVASPRTRVPHPIDGHSNDGVVNTVRQVDGEFEALVVGDHADVIGRYQRRDVADGRIVDPGLISSGAHFGDDEFFELLGMVADCIARAIRG